MSTPILATKLYIPPPRPTGVLRADLVERLNQGLHRKLTLVAAPAGFGKTTLVSAWLTGAQSVSPGGAQVPQVNSVAWLSLDDADSDPTRFLVYLVAALQKIAPALARGCWLCCTRRSHRQPKSS
jgi:LuxR family maltose regulon positive regulatory protein